MHQIALQYATLQWQTYIQTDFLEQMRYLFAKSLDKWLFPTYGSISHRTRRFLLQEATFFFRDRDLARKLLKRCSILRLSALMLRVKLYSEQPLKKQKDDLILHENCVDDFIQDLRYGHSIGGLLLRANLFIH